jgi:hypothetical protein
MKIQQTTIESLINQPQETANQYYKSYYDRLTKQIELNNEYWQLYIANGTIVNVRNMKER